MKKIRQNFQQQTRRVVGALPPLGVVMGLLTIFSVWVVVDVLLFRVTTGLATSSYDAMVRARVFVAEPDPRIVIVDIDEASLAAMTKDFGRWPWPRDTLATLLDFVESQGPVIVAWDIAFADADRFSPGGDKAMDSAAARSAHSHFSVVRLPSINDGLSKLGPAELSSLWFSNGPVQAGPAPTAAVIAPALPAVAAGRLGYNNGYPDPDGVLRRYRYVDSVTGGWALKSLAFSIASHLDGTAGPRLAALAQRHPDTLIAWRRHANSYPRVSFADVFTLAEGGRPGRAVPSFKGKIVLIGSTAPSLHDIHPTPLSPTQAGVDSLATAIDNAVNERFVREVPRWGQALIAIATCAAIALWVMFRGVASLDPVLFALPAGLLAISYASLNGAPLFIDLYLPAALGLLFLAALRFWNNLRRDHWCSLPDTPLAGDALALMPCFGRQPWTDAALDRLVDAVATHAPHCRLVVPDAFASWPSELRWPELAWNAAIIGPWDELQRSRSAMERQLKSRVRALGELSMLPSNADRAETAKVAMLRWAEQPQVPVSKGDRP